MEIISEHFSKRAIATERSVLIQCSKAPISNTDPNFRLLKAIRRYKGNFKKYQNLLIPAVNTNLINIDGETVLHEAVLNSKCDVNLVKFLLDIEPTLINRVDYAKKSALHLAMLHQGNDAVVNELLNRGAFVNIMDVLDETPLHTAVHTGHNFDILLKFGANVNAMNIKGETPLHCALSCLCKTSLKMPVLQALLSNGADVNARNQYYESVLHYAVKDALVTKGCIQLLLEYGADPNATDNYYQPPIAYCKNKGIGQLLIQYSIFSSLHKSVNLINRIEDEVLNLEYCKNSEEYSLWTTTREMCLKDMISMSSDQIGSNSTLFEYIAMRYNRKHAKVVNFFDLISVLSKYFYNSYPSCKDILYVSIKRLDLLNILYCTQIYVKISNPSSKVKNILNSDCVQHLAKYLSNNDLICLILAYVNHEIL